MSVLPVKACGTGTQCHTCAGRGRQLEELGCPEQRPQGHRPGTVQKGTRNKPEAMVMA